MGIVNVSPESFSGDGMPAFLRPSLRLNKWYRMALTFVDVGGESTKPGFTPISLEEELRRVIPAVERIASSVTVPVSVDTTKYEVALQALKAGAAILNDQWGLLKDVRLADLAAGWKTPIILMSDRG